MQGKKILSYFIFLGILGALLTGCLHPHINSSLTNHPKKEIFIRKEKAFRTKKPIPIKADLNVEKVYGWIDENTILYSYVDAGKYLLATHTLSSGEHHTIFISNAPIVNALIHEQKNTLFVHTSAHSHLAQVTYLNVDGSVLFTTDLESFELAYEWNKEDPSLMLVTAFNEDWSFDSYFINVNKKNVKEVKGIQPFAKWLNTDSILEQDWNDDVISFFAPILKRSILDPTREEMVFEGVYRFDVLNHSILTLNIPNEDNKEFLEYTFYDKNLTIPIYTIKVPNLTQYTDWLVPYYDEVGENFFYTFVPEFHGDVDQYSAGFNLIEMNLQKQANRTVLTKMDNRPLSCTSTGSYCLYGYHFEQLIDMEDGKVMQLFNVS